MWKQFSKQKQTKNEDRDADDVDQATRQLTIQGLFFCFSPIFIGFSTWIHPLICRIVNLKCRPAPNRAPTVSRENENARVAETRTLARQQYWLGKKIQTSHAHVEHSLHEVEVDGDFWTANFQMRGVERQRKNLLLAGNLMRTEHCLQENTSISSPNQQVSSQGQTAATEQKLRPQTTEAPHS